MKYGCVAVFGSSGHAAGNPKPWGEVSDTVFLVSIGFADGMVRRRYLTGGVVSDRKRG